MRVNDGTKPLQNDFIQTKKKKKIKDLTLQEIDDICHQHLNCENCPLKNGGYCCDGIGENEVEVND